MDTMVKIVVSNLVTVQKSIVSRVMNEAFWHMNFGQI